MNGEAEAAVTVAFGLPESGQLTTPPRAACPVGSTEKGSSWMYENAHHIYNSNTYTNKTDTHNMTSSPLIGAPSVSCSSRLADELRWAKWEEHCFSRYSWMLIFPESFRESPRSTHLYLLSPAINTQRMSAVSSIASTANNNNSTAIVNMLTWTLCGC